MRAGIRRHPLASGCCCCCSHINSHNQVRGHRTGSSHSGDEDSGREGQHFELFDSILGRVEKVTTHNHSLRVRYVR